LPHRRPRWAAWQDDAVPRIAADTIAEHVARQEAAVFAAAIRLFVERGYARVSLADIAAEVGLARNSLYRYFPDKAHIVVGWLRRELGEQAALARERLLVDGPPVARVQAWANDQLEYAGRPEHALLAELPQVVPQLDEPTRAELADIHRALIAPLAAALEDAGVAEPAPLGTLIGGMVLAAAGEEARGGEDPALRERLLAAIAAVIADAR
jgi:AcrR family transcriptional regulator